MRHSHRSALARRLWPGLVLLGLALAVPAWAAGPTDATGDLFRLPPEEVDSLKRALLSLPVAALLGGLLAFGQRLRSPDRGSPGLIQTQVLLAIVGAAVMVVVGTSVARGFGILGVASLVRYRVKIRDPKEASIMLASLAVGLACGVGLPWLAALCTFVTLAVIWLLESFVPRRPAAVDHPDRPVAAPLRLAAPRT